MENKYFINNCTFIPVESSSEELKKLLDEETGGLEVSNGNPTITYYESILSCSISLTLSDVIDVDQFVSKYSLSAGELIKMKVLVGENKKQEGQEDFIIDETQHKLRLTRVKDVQTTSRAQTASFEFVSEEILINETSRINKKYHGNISNIVEEILKKDVKGIKTDKSLTKDLCGNSYTFTGNLKRPFDTINWLCQKAASSVKDDCGFCFFETLDGYNFRSINEMLAAEPIQSFVRGDRTDYGNDFNISDAKLSQSNDVPVNLRTGMYANRTLYLDVKNQTLSVEDYKINNNKGITKKPKLPKDLADSPSRLMFRMTDVGAQQKGSGFEGESELDLAKYQNISYSRSNLLNAYSMQISVSFNTLLRAGDTIELTFPYRDGDGNERQTVRGKKDRTDLSGKYLISELRHEIGDAKSSTHLRVIRDTFSAK